MAERESEGLREGIDALTARADSEVGKAMVDFLGHLSAAIEGGEHKVVLYTRGSGHDEHPAVEFIQSPDGTVRLALGQVVITPNVAVKPLESGGE